MPVPSSSHPAFPPTRRFSSKKSSPLPPLPSPRMLGGKCLAPSSTISTCAIAKPTTRRKPKRYASALYAPQHLTDPLVNSAPIFVPCSSKQFKLEFYRYLEGSQTIEQLMHAINFPRIIAVTRPSLILERQGGGTADREEERNRQEDLTVSSKQSQHEA